MNNKIKAKILIPVIVATYILVTVFYVATSQLMKYNVEKDAARQFTTISNALKFKRTNETKIFIDRIYTIQNDKALQKYWLAKNRTKLLDRANIFYERIASSFHVTHFSFVDTNSVNFLRVHEPEKHGDFINKFTLENAKKTDIISSGFEIGNLGTITLRVVVPWHINGKLVGYIELGEEIEHQFCSIQKIFNINLYVLLKKEKIDKLLYENRMKKLNRNTNWNSFSKYALIYKTTDETPRNLENIALKNEILEFTDKEKKYMALSISLHSANFLDLGKVVLVLDISDSIHSKKQAILLIFITSFFVGSILIIIFYFIVRGVERTLVLYEDKATSEMKLRSIEQELHIKKLKEEEKRLKLSEERFKQVANYSNSIIWEINKKKEYTYINSVVKKVLGYEVDELIGKNGYIHFPNCKENTISLEKQNKMLELDGEYHNLIFKFVTKDGKDVWVRSSGAKIFNSKGEEVGRRGISTDVTNIQKAEQKLIEAKEKAEKADKLKTIFLAQMSHEIRTPINSIVSLTSLVQSEFEDNSNEDIQTCFSLIRKSGDRIIRTTDLILNLSEIEAGTYEIYKEDFNLVDGLLNKLFGEYSSIAKEKNLLLKLEVDLQNPIISTDSYSIEQIFRNLIDNAITYTDKGEITIKAFENSERKITVEIIDSGIGISEEYLSKMFTPFSQEMMGYTRKYEGNGVGLTLVKEYCKLNNATIEVESIKGEGSTFRVILG